MLWFFVFLFFNERIHRNNLLGMLTYLAGLICYLIKESLFNVKVDILFNDSEK